MGFARHRQGFAPVSSAGDDGKGALRQLPFPGKGGDHGVVGATAVSSLGHRDLQSIAAVGIGDQAIDAGALGAWCDPEANLKTVSRRRKNSSCDAEGDAAASIERGGNIKPGQHLLQEQQQENQHHR